MVLIDDHTRVIVTWALSSVACQAIVVFGIVTNIINIVCFVKQGFKESINISFLGLAVSDLCSLITLAWENIVLNPDFITVDLPFDAMGVMYLTAAMPHLAFIRVSCWITALITLERCLCIIVPLKVKNIITPERVSFIIICLSVTMLTSAAPDYIVNKLGRKFSPERNRTLIGLVSTADRESVQKVSFAINSIFLSFAAFFVVITCTILLVINLHKKTRWRKMSVATTHDDISNRNNRVAKMVVMISTLFISCFTPTAVIILVCGFVPDITVGGKNVNVGIVSGFIMFLCESANLSVNIFIYYHMSSKYRQAFRDVFCWYKSECQNEFNVDDAIRMKQ